MNHTLLKLSDVHVVVMVRLKHGLICVSKAWAEPIMSKKHTESHALTYLKYVTIASFDPRQQ